MSQTPQGPLPWPLYPDGTPLPAGPNGQPDFSVLSVNQQRTQAPEPASVQEPLPWPLFPDGCPLPMKADGQPDFTATHIPHAPTKEGKYKVTRTSSIGKMKRLVRQGWEVVSVEKYMLSGRHEWTLRSPK